MSDHIIGEAEGCPVCEGFGNGINVIAQMQAYVDVRFPGDVRSQNLFMLSLMSVMSATLEDTLVINPCDQQVVDDVKAKTREAAKLTVLREGALH